MFCGTHTLFSLYLEKNGISWDLIISKLICNRTWFIIPYFHFFKEFLNKITFKWPLCKDGNGDPQRYPWNFFLWKILSFWLKVFNSDGFHMFYYSRNAQVSFVENPLLKINSFQNFTHWYLIHVWSADKAFNWVSLWVGHFNL